MKEKRYLVCIVGPTGIGKTGLSIELALEFATEIISCDSRQVYKELVIGSAMPDPSQLTLIPHHFVGNKSVHDYYNAGIYELEVMQKLEDLFAQKNIVLLCGGSGLYVDAVCKGIDDLPSPDQYLRKELLDNYAMHGISYLTDRLSILDPEYYRSVDLRNFKRVLKGVEVSLQTGKPYSSFLTKPNKKRPFEILKIGLGIAREELYQRINSRTLEMIDKGWLEEAKSLLPYKNLNALNTVGYKELFAYLENEYTLDRAIALIQQHTRHYAKRQITWFSKDKDTHWVDPREIEPIVEYIKSITRS